MSDFGATRFFLLLHTHDAMNVIQAKEKDKDDTKDRGCIDSYKGGDQVLLNSKT